MNHNPYPVVLGIMVKQLREEIELLEIQKNQGNPDNELYYLGKIDGLRQQLIRLQAILR
jgi:hypothetical protein